MFRPRHAVPSLMAATAVCLAMVATAPPASAQLVERSHDRMTETFNENLCGIDVVTTVTFVDNFQIRLDRNGFALAQGHGHVTVTWFNPATGLSLTNTIAGGFKDLSVTDNGDGTITVRSQVTGIPEWIRLPDGTTLIKDVGRVVFANVLDYSGTPANIEDDVFISSTIESVSGPHPELESDFTLFCPTVVAALT